ncbi:MAG: alpha/beta hydrolase [Burkholderiaceae bacterium]
MILGERARTLVRPGAAIAYRLRPAQAQPARGTVVLLHGLASNLSRYAELVELTRLNQDWNLIRIDLRGHGESDTRDRLSLELWCEDLLALLDAEAIDRAVVVGHSLGAQVGLALAAAHPDRVRGLALIDPLPGTALNERARSWVRAGPAIRGLERLVRAANAVGLRRRRLPLRDLRAEDERARALLASGQPLDDFVRDYASTWADLRHFRVAHYLRELIELLRPPPLPAAIRCPVLVLLSAAGTFAKPAAVEIWAQGFVRGELVTIDCHHWPLTERPDAVRAAIEAWAGRLA